MLYSGKTLSENNDIHGRGQYILQFDWKGNHIKTLKTKMDVHTFCVNESSTKIYGLIMNEDLEYDILQFDI